MFRRLRILLLLFVLATVTVSAWRTRTEVSSWQRSLIVGIYPVNGDGSAASEAYLAQLERDRFEPIEAYFAAQAKTYQLEELRPVMINLASPRAERPPQPPSGTNAMDAILWSLQMRYWAWRNDAINGPTPDVRIFVLFHDPQTQRSLHHSVGLEKGMIGLVNAFAGRAEDGGNMVVIAHELMHTLGATDKYDPITLQPRFPTGYAAPYQEPLLPQNRAEIMAGRIPVSQSEAVIPRSLDTTLVGPSTASEIGWKRH